MHNLADLAWRGAYFFAFVTAIGIGLTSRLPNSFGRVLKCVLAPVLGLCIANGIATTLDWFAPSSRSYWIMPIIAGGSVLSLAITKRDKIDLSWLKKNRLQAIQAVAQIVLIAVAVAGPMALMLTQHNSSGPAALSVYDVDGYVASTDATVHQSIRQQSAFGASHVGPWRNLEQERADAYAAGFQELDMTPLASDLNVLIGQGATETFTAYLLAVAVIAALGLYATVRYVTRTSGWLAALAASFLGGVFFFRLVFDTSEGALLGLSVLFPIYILSDLTRRYRSWTAAVLLGAALSGLSALYPLFLPMALIPIFSYLAWTGILLLRRRPIADSWSLRQLPARALLAIVIALGLNVNATVRAYQYLFAVVFNQLSYVTLPRPGLNHLNVASWLFQLNGISELPNSLNFHNVLVLVIVPLLLIFTAIYGLIRFPFALVLLPGVLFSFVTSGYERVANNCTYCEERSLLPSIPILILFAALGLIALCNWSPSGRVLAFGITGTAAITVGWAAYSQFELAGPNSYFMTSSMHAAIAAIPSNAREVSLEGINESNESVGAPAEGALVYEAVNESLWGRVSLPIDKEFSSEFVYFQAPTPLPGPQFHSNYEYVLTRLGSVTTSRRAIFRLDGIAVEFRSHPLDVIVDYGITAPMQVDNPLGQTFASQSGFPIRFVVSGAHSNSAFVAATFITSSPEVIQVQKGEAIATISGDKTTVCVRATGTRPILAANMVLKWQVAPRLVQISVRSSSCPDGLNLRP